MARLILGILALTLMVGVQSVNQRNPHPHPHPGPHCSPFHPHCEIGH
jgi:hypothetical protein